MNILYQIYFNFTEKERRIFLVALFMFAVSGFLLALSAFNVKTVEVPVKSSLYREGIVGQPIKVNPIIASADADRDLVELLFGNLLELSENHKVSDDGKTWNVVLKTDLKWSDGKPLTSDDVIFTIDAIQNTESRSPLFLTWQGVIANRISELEIEFTLRTPYVFFLDNLKEFKVIPRHIFGALPAANLYLSDFNLEPIGSGPYRFASFKKRKDGFITDYYLEANENFSGQQPFIKNFQVKFYENSEGLIRAFNAKRIDGFGGLNPDDAGKLTLSHQVLEKSVPQYYAVFINKSAKPSLGFKSVLAALNLATDKQKLVREALRGKAFPVNSPILPLMEEYSEEITSSSLKFSVSMASEVLSKDKWVVNEETKFREKNIGKQKEVLDFSIVVPNIPFLIKTVDILKEDWGQIGVKLTPIILDPADVVNEVIKTRNYQMLIFGNILNSNPDIFSFWHSSERFYPGFNLALYENKKVDSLLESIRRNTDAESRKTELAQLQRIIAEDSRA